jgi:hypothetical protein
VAVLRGEEIHPCDTLLLKRFRCQAEHSVPVLFQERTAEVVAPLLGTLDNTHPELPESPILPALWRVKKVMIPYEFSQNERLIFLISGKALPGPCETWRTKRQKLRNCQLAITL